jgi:hypothetical protein
LSLGTLPVGGRSATPIAAPASLRWLRGYLSPLRNRLRRIATVFVAFLCPFGVPGEGRPCIRQRPVFIAAALEKAKTEKEARGEFESEHPGYCGAQDTFYVGNLKGAGPVYQQTFIDTYAKVAYAKLYDRKTPITAADLLNDRVLPFFDEHDVKLLRVLTDRGSEY